MLELNARSQYSVLHYLHNMTVGLVIYSKARAFKTKAKKFGLKAKD